MEPWYKVATPRKEVRQGRSFNPDEFAIALEQVVAGTAPEDYRDPRQFFSRTCFTRALRDHAGLALRRIAGSTDNTAPVLALVTQFGGGKTHTLTSLFHLIHDPKASSAHDGVQGLLSEAGLPSIPKGKVAVFVGNAWDPSPGRETPWLDLAHQLAGAEGVKALGPEARMKAPGTHNLHKLFSMVDGGVLILCDEVLNYLSRHRDQAEAFRDFLGNLVRSLTGITGATAVLSLPQSKPEMTDWDLRWQEIIAKEVNRVAKNLISNDEAEISEVVRRRLFEDLGGVKLRTNVAKAYADWCFERRNQFPPDWMAVDTATTEKKARDYLQQRFEACYPFHPATLSVFQRKWQTLPQYQQTRGTLAMFAQWISLAFKEGYTRARREPLITLGSAPLDAPEFREVVLGQLGEPRLVAAIETDIAGEHSHARALDVDTRGALRDIHRRVGTAILFESSGGQVDRIAHIPELKFAIGEPAIDTTSIDTAAVALASKAFFINRVGSDGFRLYHKATIRKAVNDRRASLDEEAEIKPKLRSIVKGEFDKGAPMPVVPFPADGAAIQDSPRLTLIVVDPELDWNGSGGLRQRIAEWTKQRGASPRLYPGSLVWCVRKPGRDLRDKVELSLAWERVRRDVAEGTLGSDYDRTDRADIQAKMAEADDAAKDEVWAAYRYVVIFDPRESDGLKVIDLGAGHASASESLGSRIIAALKSQALLNDSVGAGYLERNWPPALKESGAWPLKGLRQCFLNGSLTRLLDPDSVLRSKITEFVVKGEFGLASGLNPDGSFQRLWFHELMGTEEVAFEDGVFLLTKTKAAQLRKAPKPGPTVEIEDSPTPGGPDEEGLPPTGDEDGEPTPPLPQARHIGIRGEVPPELWNQLGTRLIPKLRSHKDLRLKVDIELTLAPDVATNAEQEIQQAIEDLGLEGKLTLG